MYWYCFSGKDLCYFYCVLTYFTLLYTTVSMFLWNHIWRQIFDIMVEHGINERNIEHIHTHTHTQHGGITGKYLTIQKASWLTLRNKCWSHCQRACVPCTPHHDRVYYASVTRHNTLYVYIPSLILPQSWKSTFYYGRTDRRCVLPGTCLW